MPRQLQNTRADGELQWRVVDAFNRSQDYWSGLNAQIYAGNQLLDELVQIQWQLEEMVMPRFGYHSYTYDTVSHGARRVQGAFTLNFRSEGYLFALLRNLQSPVARGTASPGDPVAAQIAHSGTATVDDFTALAAGAVQKDSSGRLKFDRQVLDRVAGEFEKALWGTGTPTGQIGRQVQEEVRPDRPRFQVASAWNLEIRFGAGTVGATQQRLVAVELNGRSSVLEDSGRPVLEIYSFIAKDLI